MFNSIIWRMKTAFKTNHNIFKIVRLTSSVNGLFNLGSFVRTVGTDSGAQIRIQTVMEKWRGIFQQNSISESEQSLRLILAHVLNIKNLCEVDKIMGNELSPEKINMIAELCSKRLQKMPIQYVLEEWDFRDLQLIMRPPVFIPRPETEELVSIVLKEIKSPTNFLELCCGSGAISLALLKEWSQIELATAVDQSEIACLLTMENAQKHDLHNRIRVIRSPIHCLLNAPTMLDKFDVIVSNPPYVFTEDLIDIQPEIIQYEDVKALDGGPDGLDIIKQIVQLSSRILNPGGSLYLEIDPRHPELLQDHLRNNPDLGLDLVHVYEDFCGKRRFLRLNKTSR